MDAYVGTTARMYAARRGTFRYVASWEFVGSILKWTAVVLGPGFSKLLVGHIERHQVTGNTQAYVQREVEERIDLQAWLEDSKSA